MRNARDPGDDAALHRDDVERRDWATFVHTQAVLMRSNSFKPVG